MRKTVYLLLSLAALAHSALAECIEFRLFRLEHGEKLTPGEYLKTQYPQLQNALELGYLGTDHTVITPIENDKIDFTNTVPFQHPAAYGPDLKAVKLAKRHIGTAVAAFITRDGNKFRFDGMYYNATRTHDTVIASKGQNIAITPQIKILKIRMDLTLNTEKPEWIITPMPNTPANPATYLALKYHKTTPAPKPTKAEQPQKITLPGTQPEKPKAPLPENIQPAPKTIPQPQPKQ